MMILLLWLFSFFISSYSYKVQNIYAYSVLPTDYENDTPSESTIITDLAERRKNKEEYVALDSVHKKLGIKSGKAERRRKSKSGRRYDDTNHKIYREKVIMKNKQLKKDSEGRPFFRRRWHKGRSVGRRPNDRPRKFSRYNGNRLRTQEALYVPTHEFMEQDTINPESHRRHHSPSHHQTPIPEESELQHRRTRVHFVSPRRRKYKVVTVRDEDKAEELDRPEYEIVRRPSVYATQRHSIHRYPPSRRSNPHYIHAYPGYRRWPTRHTHRYPDYIRRHPRYRYFYPDYRRWHPRYRHRQPPIGLVVLPQRLPMRYPQMRSYNIINRAQTLPMSYPYIVPEYQRPSYAISLPSVGIQPSPIVVARQPQNVVYAQAKPPVIAAQPLSSMLTARIQPSIVATQNLPSMITARDSMSILPAQLPPSMTAARPPLSIVSAPPLPSMIPARFPPSIVSAQSFPSMIAAPPPPPMFSAQAQPINVMPSINPESYMSQSIAFLQPQAPYFSNQNFAFQRYGRGKIPSHWFGGSLHKAMPSGRGNISSRAFGGSLHKAMPSGRGKNSSRTFGRNLPQALRSKRSQSELPNFGGSRQQALPYGTQPKDILNIPYYRRVYSNTMVPNFPFQSTDDHIYHRPMLYNKKIYHPSVPYTRQMNISRSYYQGRH